MLSFIPAIGNTSIIFIVACFKPINVPDRVGHSLLQVSFNLEKTMDQFLRMVCLFVFLFILTFQKQDLIDSCQRSHARAMVFKHRNQIRSDTGVVIDREPHPSCTCKTCFLFAPLAVCVHIGCYAFQIYTPTKPLIRLHIKNKTFFFFKIINNFYILDIYNKI